MSLRLRTALVLLGAMAAACAISACGGGSDAKPASASASADELLRDTFSGDKKVEAGKGALNLAIDAKGGSMVHGPISIKVDGPFESQGEKRLPKFALTAAISGE